MAFSPLGGPWCPHKKKKTFSLLNTDIINHRSCGKISNYKHGHNIMRIFNVLPNFPFTTSETKLDY